jgi:hypothetical protein
LIIYIPKYIVRFHALVIFGFGSEKWISLVGKKLPYFYNPYIDENRYFKNIPSPFQMFGWANTKKHASAIF